MKIVRIVDTPEGKKEMVVTDNIESELEKEVLSVITKKNTYVKNTPIIRAFMYQDSPIIVFTDGRRYCKLLMGCSDNDTIEKAKKILSNRKKNNLYIFSILPSNTWEPKIHVFMYKMQNILGRTIEYQVQYISK